jgi:hypothetical protein
MMAYSPANATSCNRVNLLTAFAYPASTLRAVPAPPSAVA